MKNVKEVLTVKVLLGNQFARKEPFVTKMVPTSGVFYFTFDHFIKEFISYDSFLSNPNDGLHHHALDVFFLEKREQDKWHYYNLLTLYHLCNVYTGAVNGTNNKFNLLTFSPRNNLDMRYDELVSILKADTYDKFTVYHKEHNKPDHHALLSKLSSSLSSHDLTKLEFIDTFNSGTGIKFNFVVNLMDPKDFVLNEKRVMDLLQLEKMDLLSDEFILIINGLQEEKNIAQYHKLIDSFPYEIKQSCIFYSGGHQSEISAFLFMSRCRNSSGGLLSQPAADNAFTHMQRHYYDDRAEKWSPEYRDPVVGDFDAQNAWEPYDRMLDGFDTKNMDALDFGCGPGRNIVKFSGVFRRFDGADISPVNLRKAKMWIEKNAKDMVDGTSGKLFLCNGIELDTNDNDSYDLVYSTITMQHIPVYDIRLNYLREFYRVLRPGGWVSIQMCFGVPKPPSVSYYENAYDAKGTNGECDVMISDVSQIKSDLELVGFSNFSHFITDAVGNSAHSKMIYFRAQKL